MSTSQYSSWLCEARTLPAPHPLSSWRQRAAALERRFGAGGKPRPAATYKTYIHRLKRGERLRFETVRWLGYSLLEFLIKDERGPSLSLETAANRLLLPIDALPDRLHEHLSTPASFSAEDFDWPCDDCTVDHVSSVRSLRHFRNELWVSSLSKEFRFHKTFRREVTSSVWPNRRWEPEGERSPSAWGVEFDGGSRDFTLTLRPLVDKPNELELRIEISPPPERGDHLSLTRWFRSRWLDPVFDDEVPRTFPPAVTIYEKSYSIYDGVLITEPTKILDYLCSFRSVTDCGRTRSLCLWPNAVELSMQSFIGRWAAFTRTSSAWAGN
jgi:hypothetical protein